MDEKRDTNGSAATGSAAAPAEALVIDPRLLEILVCPLTHATLVYNKSDQELISQTAKLAFPIRDGIPIMIASEARRLED